MLCYLLLPMQTLLICRKHSLYLMVKASCSSRPCRFQIPVGHPKENTFFQTFRSDTGRLSGGSPVLERNRFEDEELSTDGEGLKCSWFIRKGSYGGLIFTNSSRKVYISAIKAVIKYWQRAYGLEKGESIVYDCIQEQIKLPKAGKTCCLKLVRECAINLGYENRIDNPDEIYIYKIQNKLKQNAEVEMFKNLWIYREECHNKLRTYSNYKNDFKLQNYLELKDTKVRRFMAKYRMSNHRLKIETGRHQTLCPIYGSIL